MLQHEAARVSCIITLGFETAVLIDFGVIATRQQMSLSHLFTVPNLVLVNMPLVNGVLRF